MVWDSEPLVPVTSIVKVPTTAKLQVRFALPEPVMLDGVRAQAVLLDARLTGPAKPFKLVTVILDEPADPAFTVRDVRLAVIEKSWTARVTVTV
jgi:hypothetical protein